MDKNRNDRLKDAVKQYEKQKSVDSAKEEAKKVGLIPTSTSPPKKKPSKKKETTPALVEALLKEEKETIIDTAPMLISKENGRWRVDTQHLAIMYMEAIQGEDDDGNLIPRFTQISNLLSIPQPTLYSWWKRKEELMQQHSAVLQKTMDYVSTGMLLELARMQQALAEIDYASMVEKPADMKNFITLFNTLINKFRLFTNQSTSNVAHQHQVQMVVPED